MEIASASEIRKAEQDLFCSGDMNSSTLMERVVQRMDALLHEPPAGGGTRWQPQALVLYLGKGHNAGDAAGLAEKMDTRIYVRQLEGEPLSPDATAYLKRAARRVQVEYLAKDSPMPEEEHLLIVDGLLGSGARGDLRPAYAGLVEEMNTLRAAKPRSILLAIDIPTGLDSDTGAVSSVAVQADITAAIGCVKPGMVVDGAEDYVGRLLCIPLPEVTLPEQVASAPRVLDADLVRQWMPRRAFSCYKNKAGRVNIVAGSIGYIGAAQLCAEAALAAGAGLVALYCLPDAYPVLAARVAPEIMVCPVASYAEVPGAGAQALVVGPGLGKPSQENVKALEQLVRSFPGTLVLDADGLNLAAEQAWVLRRRSVLTPHPGEMERLFPESSVLSRAEAARRYVAARHCTLVLKGARTFVTNGYKSFYNSSGGPYMANGGHGDTLAGVIAALAAQGLSPLHAAATAVFRCGQAAACVHEQEWHPVSVTPSRVIAALPQVLLS